MVSKKKKLRNKWVSIILVFLFSLVLFINNFTDLTKKFGLYVPVQWVAWIGFILTVFYTWWMASQDKI